jgi:hypothetical protein
MLLSYFLALFGCIIKHLDLRCVSFCSSILYKLF